MSITIPFIRKLPRAVGAEEWFFVRVSSNMSVTVALLCKPHGAEGAEEFHVSQNGFNIWQFQIHFCMKSVILFIMSSLSVEAILIYQVYIIFTQNVCFHQYFCYPVLKSADIFNSVVQQGSMVIFASIASRICRGFSPTPSMEYSLY